ncbi:hypothetical protein A1359_21295 [Methylomonas lenta]|uniref:Uncharacterized protein n=1 Tax=Methylomonas lenta TaxID=980561 RepID=A0A177NRL7_9GAMM|nr:hypothetical protein A1359_21295 [Methylomonas lenta]
MQTRRNFAWNPGSAKWILKGRLTNSVVAIVRYGFISIVPIWIGVRRLPARQSKAIERLLRIPSSRLQIGLCHRQSRLPAKQLIASRGLDSDSLQSYTQTFEECLLVHTQARCFAVSKKQKQNGI